MGWFQPTGGFSSRAAQPRRTLTPVSALPRRLVLKMVEGSTAYLKHSEKHIAALRNDITSPGGTTAAGLYTADDGALRTTIAKSVWAAYRRSLELGGKDSNVGPGRSTQR